MCQKVMITGAAGGIGREAALAFARKGCELYLLTRKSRSRLEELRELLEREWGVTCHIFFCDISDYSQVKTTFREIPTLDIIVNNAGLSYYGLLHEMTPDCWKEVLDTNINGAFHICHEALPSMIGRKKGRIINISSVWGLSGASMEVAYSTSKGALNSFTKALAKELAPSNIQVNAIAFGLIDTQMNIHLSIEERDSLCMEVPAGRFASPEEAGDMIRKVSELPEYVTGQIFTMDGGWI